MVRQSPKPHVQLSLDIPGDHLAYIPIDSRFNVALANLLARKESYNKHLYRPNTYLHKWWARRCGTTFRAILKHLVRDEAKLDYYAPGGLEGQVILDPMLGGGTTLHEAIRLGANVIGVDIDPIPILQARASLTKVSLAKLKREFVAFHQALYERIGHLFLAVCPQCGARGELRFLLYGARRKCSCGEVVLVDSYILRQNSDGSVIQISPSTYDILLDNEVVSSSMLENKPPLIEKTQGVCHCGVPYQEDISIPFYRRYLPIAVVGECAAHDLFFAAPHPTDLEAIAYADSCRDQLDLCRAEFAVMPGPKSMDLLKRGVNCYLDLFSSRQLLYLQTASELLDDFDADIRLKIALLISTSAEFNSMLCGYKGASKRRPGAIRHVFSHHAYSFPYTALENNPLQHSPSSGTLLNLFRTRLFRGQAWALRPMERLIGDDGQVRQVPIAGEVDGGTEYRALADLRDGTHRFMLMQGSAVHLNLPDESVDHIVTDPPYYDSVQYGDLAAYFRVWLRHFLPEEAQWSYPLDDMAISQQSGRSEQYETVMRDIFAECYRVLKKDQGRLVFTFHHWSAIAWTSLTLALRDAGFRLVNRYVIHAENPTSVHIANQRALVHDVVLVLAAEGNPAVREWQCPRSVDATDSYIFCEQCGTALGYLLASHLSRSDVEKVWKELLAA